MKVGRKKKLVKDRSRPIGASVSAEAYAKIKGIARANGKTVSYWTNRAILEFKGEQT